MGSTMIMSHLSIKVLIISAGIFVALAMGITIFSVHEIPVIWWLKPPYLHLITNAIIISIVGSARFRRTQSEPPPEHLITVKTPPPSYYGSLSIYTVVEDSITAGESEDMVVELEPTAVNGSRVVIETKEVLDEAKHMIIDSVSAYNLPSQEIISPDQPQLELLSPLEKPVLSPRSCHGNLIKTSPDEAGTLSFISVTRAKVSCAIPFPGAKTPREPETLESIWKMITEKRQAEHVPKSGTSLKGQNYYDLPGSAREVAESKDSPLFKDETRQESYKEILKREL